MSLAEPQDLLQCTFDELKSMTARADALVERLRAEGVPWEDIAAALRRDDAAEE